MAGVTQLPGGGLTKVIWNPAPFNATITSAFREAARATAVIMDATKPQHDIPIKGPFFSEGGQKASIRTGGLAPIFEKGAKPHDIFPKGAKVSRASKSKGQSVFKVRAVRGQTTKVLSLGPGYVVAFVHHPGMAAQPFILPQTITFPARFRNVARIRLASSALKAA